MEEVSKEHVIYLETRFAPVLLTRLGLSVEEAVESVLEGLSDGYCRYGVHAVAILCVMRDRSLEDGYLTLETAKKQFGKGVVAMDLAGDERSYPASHFCELFQTVKEVGIPFTIHAGEADGVESVRAALNLGAARIGHGIALKDNDELLRYCVEHRIGIEICPCSNLQTKAANAIETSFASQSLKRELMEKLEKASI